MEQTPNTRKFHIKENPENVLYQAWKEADASARPQIEQNLLPLLRRHAAKVCWLVLHYHSDHLIEEIVEDAIINLPKFNGLSLFSTWFHACAMGTARVALRKQIRRKEVPVNEVLSMPNEPKDPEKDLFIREIKERLNDSDRRLFDLKAKGFTDKEIGVDLDLHPVHVQRMWRQLSNRLRFLYGRKVG